MSVEISFLAATADELARAEREPDWAEELIDELYDFDNPSAPGRPDCGPEKAWAGLQYLFDRAGVGIDFLMDGGEIKDDGTLFGRSVEQTASAAQELRAVPWERLAVHYDAERMMKEEVYPRVWASDPEGESEWLRSAYEELVAFFDAAAGGGYGAFMTFSF